MRDLASDGSRLILQSSRALWTIGSDLRSPPRKIWQTTRTILRAMPFEGGWFCLAADGFRGGRPRGGLVWYLREGRPSRRLSLLARYNFWEMEADDVDGDGMREIALCTWSRTRQDPRYARRFFVYGWDGHDLYPKWRGSRLGRPYFQARLVRFRGDESPALLSVEAARNGRRCLAAYRWNDFGFTGLGRSPEMDKLTILNDTTAPPLVRAQLGGTERLYAVERVQERLRFRRICSLVAESVIVPIRSGSANSYQVLVFRAGRIRRGRLFNVPDSQPNRRR